MNDITLLMKETISRDVLWSVNAFFQVIEEMKNYHYQISFWEYEENWATISSKDVTIGYLWKKYPLFFITSYCADKVHTCLEKFDFITFIPVDNLSEKKFRMNRDVLIDESDLDLNFDEFSAEDLWFYTISI